MKNVVYCGRTRFEQGKPMSWLPNQEGFRFIGVKRDDTTVECTVAKDEKGMHHIEGFPITEFVGWRDLPE